MKQSYLEYRHNIKTGDLLTWSTNSRSKLGKLLMNIIRVFTRSQYAHVGIAWWVNDRLMVVEADLPKVRVAPVSTVDNFYHIAMNLSITEEQERWLLSKVGEEYSILKAIKSYFRLELKDNHTWQCAELVNKFYKFIGIDYGNNYIPAKFIDNILTDTDKSIVKVNVR